MDGGVGPAGDGNTLGPAGEVVAAGGHLAGLVDRQDRPGGRGVLVGLVQGDRRGGAAGRIRSARDGGRGDDGRLIVSGHDGEAAHVGGDGQRHGLAGTGRGRAEDGGGQGVGDRAHGHVGLARRRAIDVLIHVGIEPENPSQGRALQGRAEVAPLLGGDEQLVLQQRGLADRGQDEVAALQRGLVDVQLLAGLQHVVLAVGGVEVRQPADATASGRRGSREPDRGRRGPPSGQS